MFGGGPAPSLQPDKILYYPGRMAPTPSDRRGAAAEDRVLAYLERHAGELFEFARELIRTPSPNPPGDERAMAAAVAARLRSLGVGRVRLVGATVERPNVIADLENSQDGPALVLSGHLDTKPAGDLEAWATDPWDPVVAEGQLFGLGSGDMKAAVAAMVYAAGAVAAAGDVPGRLTLVLTADEEAGSTLGAKWLVDEGLVQADAAIIGEPGGVLREWESIHLVSRGIALFRVHVRGTQMHSSISDRLPGVNASVQMARLMVRMENELRGRLRFDPHPLCPTGPTVNVGVLVSGGVYYGVYPGIAEFACDIRTLPGMSEQVLIDDVQAFLEQAMSDDPTLDASLEWVKMVPACEISPDEPVVTALRSATRDVLGVEPRLDAFPGATDAPYFQLGAGIPTVAAVGPGLLPLAHGPNEHLAADGILDAARVFALTACRYLSGPDPRRAARARTQAL